MESANAGNDAIDIQRRVQENMARQQRLFEELAKKGLALPAGGLTEPPKVETPADSTIRSAADEAFDQIDTNGDGVITRNEWIAAMNPSSPHDNASVATTPAVPQAAPQAAPESVRQAVLPPSLPRPVSPPFQAFPPPPVQPMSVPGMFAGPAGIEKMVSDCWRRDTVIADQMKQLYELRQQTERAASASTEAQLKATALDDETTRLRHRLQAEEQSHHQQVKQLKDEKQSAQTRAENAEAMAKKGLVDGAAATQTVDMLRQQLSDRDRQIAHMRAELEEANMQLRQAREATEVVEAGRRGAEMQAQMLQERNTILEGQIQTLVQRSMGQPQASTHLSTQAPEAPPNVSALEQAVVAELMNLEQFIRSSAAQVNVGMFMLPLPSSGALPPAISAMHDKCKRAVSDLVNEMRGAKGQLHELRLANDVSSSRANGLDASKAELHQELVEACRRLSELHNRVTCLEVENVGLLNRCRELDGLHAQDETELEARRKFAHEICMQLMDAERSVRDVSKNASWSPTLVHRELGSDAPWSALKVALSEQATSCTVAMQACVRGLSGLEGKLQDVNQAVEQAQQDSKDQVARAEAQAEERIKGIKEAESKAREMLQEDLDRQLRHAQEQSDARKKSAEQADATRLAEHKRVIDEYERMNGTLRMQIDELHMEVSHNRERMAGFERCNAENGRLVVALETRSKELEGAIATMVPPSKHSALERDLQECTTKLSAMSEEKESAAGELESLLTVIRELRIKLQEGEDANKGLEKENMKLCWQHVEWKTQLGAMQEAIRKRDERLLECEAESEQRKSELMQVVSRSKSAQGDLKALQELVEASESQRQNDAHSHQRVVVDLQRKNEELQQREAALRAHLEQLDAQLQRSRHLSMSGDTTKAVAGVAAVADELSGRLAKMRSTSPARALSPSRR